MTEDFIIEDEAVESPNRRPFLISVGILLTVFVLAAICSITVLSLRNGSTDNAQADRVATIEAQNAIVAVTNEAVTATIAAMETEAARPTNTPAAPPTNTPAPTVTPQPTNTPVVRQADDDATKDAGTAAADSDAPTDDDTDTAFNASTPTPISAPVGTNGGGGDDSLPQTGIETWGVVAAALVLVFVLFSARRLRNG